MGGPRRSGFKQFTSEMVFGKTVTVHVTDRDGYGRTVADVILPDSRVLNRELGAAGLAWWYRIQGEGDDKWKNGHPPEWFEKGRTPLDRR